MMTAAEGAEARRQIRSIIATYFDALDTGDMVALGEVFRYARVRTPSQGGDADLVPLPNDPYEGAERALEVFRHSTRFFDGIPCTKHFTSNLTIDIDFETARATARSRFSVVQARPSLPLQPIVAGRYVDSFERRGERWWLVDRFEDCFLWGDVREHLHPAVLGRLSLPNLEN